MTPRNRVEQYWAARALTAETLLKARTEHHREIRALSYTEDMKRYVRSLEHLTLRRLCFCSAGTCRIDQGERGQTCIVTQTMTLYKIWYTSTSLHVEYINTFFRGLDGISRRQ